MKQIGLAFLTLLLAVPGFGAGAPDDRAPFRNGEIVVFASPAELGGLEVTKYLPRSGASIVRVTPGRELGMVQKLRERGLKSALNLIAHKAATVDDSYYSPYQWHLSHVQSDQAWNLTTGSGVTVAVLDTGLMPGGADGIGCVSSASYDIVNNDSDPRDGDGHGTHVSGTIAQRTNNGTGTAGLAYGACIMAVKVLDDSGSGSMADIAEGIYYAVDQGAKVINMSLGINARYGITNDPVVDPALDHAWENGVTVVVASGNDGNRNNVSYPAIYPTVIAVGSTDFNNDVVRYSNKGTGLDLVAPGGDTSTDANGDGYVDGVLQETYIDGAWGYYFFQGTSMAAPHVAAAAAMLIANGTATTPQQVYDALTSTALDVEDAGFDSKSAHGLIQVYAALTGTSGGGGGGGGSCTDADGDGYCVEEGDCNDSDASINPGATDRGGKKWSDGIDNDCNGVIDG